MFGRNKKSKTKKFKFVYPDWLYMGYLVALLGAHQISTLRMVLDITPEINDALLKEFIELSDKAESEFEYTNFETEQLISYEQREVAYSHFLEITVQAAEVVYSKDQTLKVLADLNRVRTWAALVVAHAMVEAEQFTWVDVFGTGESPRLRGD